jgi:uncharacterized protein (DUF433 family)
LTPAFVPDLMTILKQTSLGGSNMKDIDRITLDPRVMGGKACIRGMRVTVGAIVGLIGNGHSIEQVLADHPYLERNDVLQALRYAAWRADGRDVVLPAA